MEQGDGTRRATKACAKAALQRLKRDCSARFPYQDVVALLRAGAAVGPGLASEGAVQEVRIPSGAGDLGRVLVIGDTHGQLEDVLWIFFKHGEPCAQQNVCVFNGDIADRGQNAIEILMLAILYKLAEPGCVYVNRGNHEDSFLTSMYGFRDECLEKYGRDGGRQVYDLARELFNKLALGCIIDAGPGRRIFVVHGGLPRGGAALQTICDVNFRREVPAPPAPGEDEVFFDCLWTDPQQLAGVGPNIRGPHVASFGPDITQAFLRASQLDLVIRSHAVPKDGRGIEWHHDSRVLTVFSASNYCGSACNMGGVVAVRRGVPVETFEHWAGSRHELVQLEERVLHASERLRLEAARRTERRRRRRNRAEGLEKIQRETLEHVKERVVACKGQLRDFWAALDDAEDYHITAAAWKEGMARFLGEDLPWDWVQEKLEVVDPGSGRVPYTRFLQRFRVAQEDMEPLEAAEVGATPRRAPSVPGWQGVVVRRVFEALLAADLPLRDVLAAVDRNADGTVGAAEMGAIASDCGIALTPTQSQAMVRELGGADGSDSSGDIRLFDFLDSMTRAFSGTRRPAATPVEGWVPKALGKIREVLVADARHFLEERARAKTGSGSPTKSQTPMDEDAPPRPTAELLCVWFRKADMDGDGYLCAAELERELARLAPELQAREVPCDSAALAAIVGYVAWREQDRVNYMELLAAMVPCKDAAGPMGEDAAEAVALAIFAGRASLVCVLRERFDPAGSGSVTAAEFAEGLAAVASASPPRTEGGEPLPRARVEALVTELCGSTDGQVPYEAFINSFHIVEGLGYAPGRSVSCDGSPLSFACCDSGL